MKEDNIRENIMDKDGAYIESYLGSPDKKNQLNDNLTELCYNDPFMTLYLIKVNDTLVFQSIHLSEIEYDSTIIIVGITKRIELINMLRKTHEYKKLKYVYSVEEDVDEMLVFPNIDLTVWVENNVVSDISIEKD